MANLEERVDFLAPGRQKKLVVLGQVEQLTTDKIPIDRNPAYEWHQAL